MNQLQTKKIKNSGTRSTATGGATACNTDARTTPLTMAKAMAHSKSPPRRHIAIFPPNGTGKHHHHLNRKHLSISDFKLPVIAERLQQYKMMNNLRGGT